MIPQLLGGFLCIASAVAFEPQQIDELRVIQSDRITGERSANFIQADIDGDGLIDLLFANRVRFQRDGEFHESPLSRMPFTERAVEIDQHQAQIYVKSIRGLEIYSLNDSAWSREAEYAISWPDAGAATPQEQPKVAEEIGTPRLRSFLLSVEGTDAPLVVLPYFDGLHFYQRSSGGYREWPALNLFPQPSQDSYNGDRATALPTTTWNFRMLLQPDKLNIWVPNRLWASRMRYDIFEYPLVWNENGLQAEAPQEHKVPDVPEYVVPCRLNDDDRWDFAGGTPEKSRSGLFPIPLYVTQVSCDEGRTFRRFQVRGWQPNASLIDIDGDGRKDIITESTSFLRSGPKETLTRWLTKNRITHDIAIYLQDSEGHFASAPSMEARTTIRLPSPPVRNDEFFHRYRWGELVSLAGDYNGDGFSDLAVQNRTDVLEIWLGSEKGFQSKSDLKLDIPPMSRFVPYDVDADGRTDLVITTSSESEEAENARTFVHFSREDVQ